MAREQMADSLGDRTRVRLEIVKQLIAGGKSVREKEVDRLEAIVILFGPFEETSRYLALTKDPSLD